MTSGGCSWTASVLTTGIDVFSRPIRRPTHKWPVLSSGMAGRTASKKVYSNPCGVQSASRFPTYNSDRHFELSHGVPGGNLLMSHALKLDFKTPFCFLCCPLCDRRPSAIVHLNSYSVVLHLNKVFRPSELGLDDQSPDPFNSASLKYRCGWHLIFPRYAADFPKASQVKRLVFWRLGGPRPWHASLATVQERR